MKIGLVLGGGGARGYAHVGVFKAMEELGLQPAAIAGCSMGGLVGAMIAAGHNSERIFEIIKATKRWDLLAISRNGALIGGQGMTHEMEKHLPRTFEELTFPLAVTAVDLQKGNIRIFSNGLLHNALRATSSVPGIISPQKIDNHHYIDGGLLNNLPVDIIGSLTEAPVIAVDVASPRNRNIPLEDSIIDRAKIVISGKKRPVFFELFMKAFDIPGSMLTDTRLALNPPDLLLRPDLDPDLKMEDMGRFQEAIDAGYAMAKTQLPEFIKNWKLKG